MTFDMYNVEARDVVKCISAVEGKLVEKSEWELWLS